MEQYSVDAYICGHDHNLQHIRSISGTGMDHVICGAGGAGLYRYRPENEEYILAVCARLGDCLLFMLTWPTPCLSIYSEVTISVCGTSRPTKPLIILGLINWWCTVFLVMEKVKQWLRGDVCQSHMEGGESLKRWSLNEMAARLANPQRETYRYTPYMPKIIFEKAKL